MSLKDNYYAALDAWDKFKSSPLKTHLAVFVCGVVVGIALVFKHA